MPFEINLVTEQRAGASTPAAEIHFDRQRVCSVRLTAEGDAELFIDGDQYLGRPTQVTFAWFDFQAVVEEALVELADWQRRLTEAGLG